MRSWSGDGGGAATKTEDCGGCMTQSTGERGVVQGPFSKSGNQARGMKTADFQGISMISGSTKSILILGRGLL